MTGGFGAYPEHHFRKIIPGNIETVRQRLCDVLEEFNYVVLNENPIQAKRAHTKNVFVSTILDCDGSLTIALKSISPASTLATFNYAVQYLFTKGDTQVLEREADAIIALATTSLDKTVCPSCHTENTGATRFCRTCGMPVARNELPSDLEVMRLMAGASSSQQEIVMGLGLCLLTLLVTLPMILLGKPKAVITGWVLLALGEFLGSLTLLYGMRRLHRTLNPANASQEQSQPDVPRVISMQERVALPPPVSVTEGTTELMNPTQRVPAPVKSARDTDSIE